MRPQRGFAEIEQIQGDDLRCANCEGRFDGQGAYHTPIQDEPAILFKRFTQGGSEVLARIAARVFTIEIHDALARQAAATLERLGFGNVRVRTGDGFFGWPEEAPFDGIIVTAAARDVPPDLFAQLKEGARLVIPLGDPQAYQVLTVVTKRRGKAVADEVLDVRFVPMTGEAIKKK